MADTVVLYPAPGIGHVISTVELGKLFLRRCNPGSQLSIVILLTTGCMDSPTIDSYIASISRSHPAIKFRRLPPLSLGPTGPSMSFAAVVFDFIRRNSPNVLRCLQEIAAASTIRALILDLFCPDALAIARDMNIPPYYFYTSGATALAAFIYFPTLFDQSEGRSFKDQHGVVLEFPAGLPSLKATEMPAPTLDRNDPSFDDMYNFCTHLPKADGLLINSFDALEPKGLEILNRGACLPQSPEAVPPVYCTGPLIGDETSRASDEGGGQEWLAWLDKQPRKSVVFLCFGSRGTFSREQVEEVAVGLENSGHRFLWVVKNPPSDNPPRDVDLDALLPEGFLERTVERGVVVKSWAPQVTVLGKEAVGGFVTHCGWNSVLEAVAAGVPMVAWPLYAEQHLNRNILVEDMKMAIGVEQRDGDGLVTAEEVERVVRELMESERGRELREKSSAMRNKAKEALGDAGSSTKNLAKLTQLWLGPK